MVMKEHVYWGSLSLRVFNNICTLTETCGTKEYTTTGFHYTQTILVYWIKLLLVLFFYRDLLTMTKIYLQPYSLLLIFLNIYINNITAVTSSLCICLSFVCVYVLSKTSLTHIHIITHTHYPELGTTEMDNPSLASAVCHQVRPSDPIQTCQQKPVGLKKAQSLNDNSAHLNVLSFHTCLWVDTLPLFS